MGLSKQDIIGPPRLVDPRVDLLGYRFNEQGANYGRQSFQPARRRKETKQRCLFRYPGFLRRYLVFKYVERPHPDYIRRNVRPKPLSNRCSARMGRCREIGNSHTGSDCETKKPGRNQANWGTGLIQWLLNQNLKAAPTLDRTNRLILSGSHEKQKFIRTKGQKRGQFIIIVTRSMFS